MGRLFGTDGMRAVAGEYPLEAASLRALGEGLVALLRAEGLAPRILIGRDTRESGGWMEQALAAGISGAGGAPDRIGVLPTSAVSLLTRLRRMGAGIVISASHNPYWDNGIKIFSPEGFKIPESWEERLEAGLPRRRPAENPPDGPAAERDASGAADYAAFLKGRIPDGRLARRLRVVLDCANGAGSAVAPEVMRDLGLEVDAIGDRPDGRNINDGCGSLHPEGLAREVLRRRADFGAAYDGDADRAVWVDERGRVLNGDHTLYVQARHMRAAGLIKGGTVVGTSMTNLGLERALEGMGLGLVRTQVGDRYVLQRMRDLGANLGGEPSGHTIFLDDCPTGDGILTSLRMLEVLASSGLSLSRLVEGFVPFPQVLINVPVARKPPLEEVPSLEAAIGRAKAALGERGRLEVRYSGTEPLLRVMVEGEDQAEIEAQGRRLADVAARALSR